MAFPVVPPSVTTPLTLRTVWQGQEETDTEMDLSKFPVPIRLEKSILIPPLSPGFIGFSGHSTCVQAHDTITFCMTIATLELFLYLNMQVCGPSFSAILPKSCTLLSNVSVFAATILRSCAVAEGMIPAGCVCAARSGTPDRRYSITVVALIF